MKEIDMSRYRRHQDSNRDLVGKEEPDFSDMGCLEFIIGFIIIIIIIYLAVKLVIKPVLPLVEQWMGIDI